MYYTFSSPSTRTTEGIKINVRTAYISEESYPRNHYYVFAYQVEIINESLYEVQLITRKWHIIDGIGSERVVEGEGVVGRQPVIRPGETHRYISGAHFQTHIGKMFGTYTMVRQIDQASFEVEIPPFIMTVPFINN